jgi:hypothetical protein
MAGLDHAGLPEAVKALGEKAPASWQELAACQSATVWDNPPPPKKRDPYEKRVRRLAALDKLHKAGGADYIADYYADIPDAFAMLTIGRVETDTKAKPAPTPAPLTPTDERNQLAGDYDSSWRETDAQISWCADNAGTGTMRWRCPKACWKSGKRSSKPMRRKGMRRRFRKPPARQGDSARDASA